MPITDKRTQNRRKLQSLLRELFQFDSADLDFGIYRIMNQKRDDVERFVEEELLDAVEEALEQFRTAEREQLGRQLAGKRRQLGEAAFDKGDQMREKFRELTIAQEFMELRQRLDSLEVAEETEACIFNDLFTFFSRYYDNGDFLTERRYSSKEAKFGVPYNGEEVLLHWANRDQYYVKTTERFTDYRFNAGDYAIWFRLQRADVPQDNIKGDKRYFVLRDETPLAFDEERKTLTIFFEYRRITQEEEAHFLGVYNAREPKRGHRKTLDRSILCEVLEVEILGALREPNLKAHLAVVPEHGHLSTLGRHLNRYTARNTTDYFVHRDLGGFLRRELDFFLKSEVLRLDDVMADDGRELLDHVLARARVVRQIADRIITFLSQIEELQKRLFEKKKFVVHTDYCVTLDRVPVEFYPEILENEDQLEEWQRLYSMEAWDVDLGWTGEFDIVFLQNHPYLMLDTTFFDEDFKGRVLATFDDLDGATDGVLIHGENFQSLNLLRAKYEQQVKCIYIDPPYNSAASEILYKNDYKHSSWLTLMANRIDASQRLLASEGVLIVAIDENEQERLGLLLDCLLSDYQKTCVPIVHNPRGIQGDNFSYCHDYAYFVFPRGGRYIHGKTVPEDQWEYSNLRKWGGESTRDTGRTVFYPIYVKDGEIARLGEPAPDDFHPEKQVIELQNGEIEVWPIDRSGVERKWRYSRETLAGLLHATRVVKTEDELEIQIARVYERYRTLWNEPIYDAGVYGTRLLGNIVRVDDAFADPLYPKSLHTVKDSLDAVVKRDREAVILDFFAGSGTTAHALMELNRDDGGRRKYILVEVADYFDSLLKPRLQRVAFSGNWKECIPQDHNGQSHMFKYQRIESYEDALNNICVCQPESAQRRLLHAEYDDYMLSYMLDFETRHSSTLLTQEAFDKPFQYTLKIQEGDQSPRDTVVHLVETFHYLIGMHVRRLEQHEQQGRRYVVSRGEVRTEHGVQKVVTIWRDTEGLDLEQEADWAKAELLTDPVERVYVNGPSFIDKAQPLEITFRQRMQGGARGA